MKNKDIMSELSKESTRWSRKAIISLKAKTMAKRTWPEKAADWLANSFGTIAFFAFNVVCFAAWMVINLEFFEGIAPFDPFPFGLLTMLVSLEAIFLSIVVLISQNRAAKIDEWRQEIDLRLDTISEQEITKIMEMLVKIMKYHEIPVSQDTVLKEMLKPTNVQKIEDDLNNQL